MNAGAYGGQLSDIIESVKYLDEDCNIKEITNKDLEFGYRKSLFSRNKNYTIIETTFKLTKGDKKDIEEVMEKHKVARVLKQPLDKPNAGSVFKRPEGYFVGKLIQDCNLQGVKVGGACVSTKHAGFIINDKEATCKDIKKLIELIQKTVKDKYNVLLETEIEFIGRD